MNFDSKEELYFSFWLEELEQAGYINSWNNAKTYQLGEKIVNKYTEQLKTKSKEKEQTILNGCEYTPDFEINWNEKANNLFYTHITNGIKTNLDLLITDGENISINTSIVEIKANFDNNNMTRLNGINRKWMYQKYSVFVNLVKVPDIFKDTFTPKKYLVTDTGKQIRLIHLQTRSLEEYIKLKTT